MDVVDALAGEHRVSHHLVEHLDHALDRVTPQGCGAEWAKVRELTIGPDDSGAR